MNRSERDLSPRARQAGIAIWASFLAACAGSMCFFAFIAPEELLHEQPLTDVFDHLGVYTLGFFSLWLLAGLASALTLFMIRPDDGRTGDRRGG